MRIKVGIFFGGPSREREISFAGGRTVYDNLDKALFEPVPIFVDSFRKWYLLDWQYLYRGTIRDFFPPIADAPKSKHGFQVYQESLGPQDELSLEAMGRKVGRRIRRHELPEMIDVAFLALHGEYGEDGQLQRELEYAGIPYTGSGVRASEIGMDKAVQKEMMSALGFPSPPIHVIENGDFDAGRPDEHFATCVKEIGWPMVVRPARQGSSIGVAILKENDGREAFVRAVNAAFFREILPLSEYEARDAYERLELVRQLSDLRDGIAFPMDATFGERTITLYTPDELHEYLENLVNSRHSTIDSASQPQAQRADDASNGYSNASNDGTQQLANSATHLLLTGHQSEQRVIVEGFINGKEFSTIVVRTDDGEVVALPPTEIVKPASELFDYRSKYMPGRSRKVTPIELPTDRIRAIRSECERLYEALGFQVYARIDGFHTASGEIFLNDPNTTSGMMPSSFFFHQAAEIGLNPSQFLTFIVRQSLRERGMPGEDQEAMEVAVQLGEQLDAALAEQRSADDRKERIAVILGGVSFERHISVESGRNIYEKLASSEGFRPVPVFLTREETPNGYSNASNDGTQQLSNSPTHYSLFQLPINLLLKDNADDIRDKLSKTEEHPVVAEIREACAGITRRYADPDVVFQPREIPWSKLPEVADGAFIALHGRPGEDGQVQAKLEPLGLYYNGSGIASSQITINKHDTLLTLREAGLPVTEQWLATAAEFITDEYAFYDKVERLFGYPLIAKPVDDGCSSAVKLIKQRDELHAYCHLTFRPSTLDEKHARREMKLTAKDEWPVNKTDILFEQAITAAGAEKFLEITGGLLTHYGVDGNIRYEMFEPSETLAGGEILSLEEKFLAGEGQNLTPARLATEDYSYDYVAGQVKADLERAARAVGAEGYCRIDAFVRVFADGRVETVPIEVNSLPGMTPATAIFHQAALAGYQPAEFIARILEYGKARRDRAVATPPRATAPEPRSAKTYLASRAPTADAILANSATNAFMDNPEEKTNPEDISARVSHVSGDFTPDPATPADGPSTEAFARIYEEVPPTHAPVEETKRAGGFKGFAGSAWRLFKSGYLWKSLALAAIFFVACFFILKIGLSLYTAHGSSTQLPDFVGMQRVEAEEVAGDLGLKIKFEKGPFDPNRPPGQVVLQHPKAGAGVKTNRSIYLTVLSDEAPLIQLPQLVGNYDYTQYTTKLERMGDIKSKIREQVYDPKLEENTILYFFYEDTKVTDAMTRSGFEVPQGSTLDFVVSVRQTGEVSVPDFKCKRFNTVEFRLDASNLLLGKVNGNVANRDDAYVVRTEPAGGTMVPVGSKLNVYLSSRRPDGCD